MLVMPSNNTNSHALNKLFPGRIGMLMSPDGLQNPKGLPWALDNGMYGAWKRSGFSIEYHVQLEHWDAPAFLDALRFNPLNPPLWVVVPDSPGNARETRRLFRKWAPKLEPTGTRLALAVQDGMTPKDVPDGVVAFIGGTTDWKWEHFRTFAEECQVTHVARVNSPEKLWECHNAGVDSVDGTGWFRGDRQQLKGLLNYLCDSHVDNRPTTVSHVTTENLLFH